MPRSEADTAETRSKPAVQVLRHSGRSMLPVLRDGDLLQVLPVPFDELAPGDVIAVERSESDTVVVHRVVARCAEGLTTRGDWNLMDDEWLVTGDGVVGKVVAVLRGRRTVTIHGGRRGLRAARRARLLRRLDRPVSRLLHRPYAALIASGWPRRLLHRWFPVRVVTRSAGGDQIGRVLLRSREIGRWDPRRRRWAIDRPYRLLVDESVLPMVDTIEEAPADASRKTSEQ